MEDFSYQAYEPHNVPDILFYRNAAFLIMGGGIPSDPSLSINPRQLSFARTFIGGELRRPIAPAELMFIDGYCGLAAKAPHSIAIDDLTANDGYIATVYAELMSKRQQLHPHNDTPPTVSDLIEAVEALSKDSQKNEFPFSEKEVFVSSSNESARLTCLSERCRPIAADDGICIGQRQSVPRRDSSSATAVIFAAIGQRPDDLNAFLASEKLITSSASAEPCHTDEIFTRLTERYSEFFIDTVTLPAPTSRQYGGKPYFGEEIFYAELCDAFLTDRLFGDSVILVHGSRSEINKLCALASSMRLSHFSGIYTKRKSGKKPLPSHIVRINSRLFRVLSGLCDSMSVTIPDHGIENGYPYDALPDSSVIFEDGYDIFVKSSSPITPTLPFRRGLYTALSAAVHARMLRRDAASGQLSLAVRLSLCFNDKESAGASIAALLGLCHGVRGGLPIASTHLSLTDSDKMSLTVVAHDFAQHEHSSSLDAESVKNSLYLATPQYLKSM